VFDSRKLSFLLSFSRALTLNKSALLTFPVRSFLRNRREREREEEEEERERQRRLREREEREERQPQPPQSQKRSKRQRKKDAVNKEEEENSSLSPIITPISATMRTKIMQQKNNKSKIDFNFLNILLLTN